MTARRAYTDMAGIESDLAKALTAIRKTLQPKDGTPEDEALTHVESFCAVALRVMRKTNPSRIRDAGMMEEIKARIEGRATE